MKIQKEIGNYFGSAKCRAFSAYQKLIENVNRISGYAQVQISKVEVIKAEQSYNNARKEWKEVKTEYETKVGLRSRYQRDINSLLQRQHAWTKEDVNKFTELYAEEHALDRRESELRSLLKRTEDKVDETHSNMMDTIRKRYQDEQVWSDYVKMISTYGTFGLMSINISLFFVFNGYLEPRRRRNLVDGIVDRVLMAEQSSIVELRSMISGNMEKLLKSHHEQQIDASNMKIEKDKEIGRGKEIMQNNLEISGNNLELSLKRPEIAAFIGSVTGSALMFLICYAAFRSQ